MGRILIIDDDDGIRAAMQGLLELEGYVVRAASHGLEGWEAIAQGFKPDLILLDLMMPVMDGREFIQHLAREGRHDLNVVAMTAAQDANAHTLGIPLVRKPMAAETLLRVVEELVPNLGSEEIAPSSMQR